jgi:hypothetical protein
MRYQGDKIDIGIFAPESMLSVVDAGLLIDEFIELWT